jgi:hypothetical protein
MMLEGIKVYTCPICKQSFPEISNSAPHTDGAPCISCYMKERGVIYNEQIPELSKEISS